MAWFPPKGKAAAAPLGGVRIVWWKFLEPDELILAFNLSPLLNVTYLAQIRSNLKIVGGAQAEVRYVRLRQNQWSWKTLKFTRPKLP